MPKDFALPEGIPLSKPTATPLPIRDAATVVLLRDGAAGLEVFLLRRVLGMAFAGGMTVFPGGGVDPRDAEASPAWAGPGVGWWAERFAVAPELARALVCAAVRETFEESGVLLAGPDADSVVADTRPFAAARAALVDRSLSFAEFLTEAGLVLRADLLRPWANWLTPAEEPRRYDTRFFLAELPAGQRADGETTEADQAGWHTPADAIEDWKAGRRGLLAPTWITLADLAELDSVGAAMAEFRQIDKIVPKVIREGDSLRVVLPGDTRFDAADAHLDARPGDRLERP
ncbi:MAG TPA: NUDIX hydrolase [Pseudonocardiaceae bacterium]|nr:NUDIX hydrolase [Pseudonocardiaceae bacterium]